VRARVRGRRGGAAHARGGHGRAAARGGGQPAARIGVRGVLKRRAASV
jgi:hypothetical protein